MTFGEFSEPLNCVANRHFRFLKDVSGTYSSTGTVAPTDGIYGESGHDDDTYSVSARVGHWPGGCRWRGGLTAANGPLPPGCAGLHTRLGTTPALRVDSL